MGYSRIRRILIIFLALSILFYVLFFSIILFVLLPLLDQGNDHPFEIFDELIGIYMEIGAKYNIPWSLLAALSKFYVSDPSMIQMKSMSQKYDPIINQAAEKYKVDPDLIRAIITQESRWNPNARSDAGAVGLMQLMPDTCKQYNLTLNECYDPQKNIDAGTRYIAEQLRRFKDLKLALAAYNVGPVRVQECNCIPKTKNGETEKYVPAVISYYHQIKGALDLEAYRKQVDQLARQLVMDKDIVKKEKANECKEYLEKNPSKFGEWSCVLYFERFNQDLQKVKSIEKEALEWEARVKYTGGKLPWPCNGPVTSEFGPRWGRMHEGIDIGCGLGTPIQSVADGVVVKIKADPGGYGYYIDINHGGGMTTRYAHMYPETVKVKAGQRVKRGQVIAEVGNNGRSTGPHLHFEVLINNQPVDPRKYLANGNRMSR